MTLKDLLRKKDKVKDAGASSSSNAAPPAPPPAPAQDIPEITFMRTTTTTQELIRPPSFPGDHDPPEKPKEGHRRLSLFRKHTPTPAKQGPPPPTAQDENRRESLFSGRRPSSPRKSDEAVRAAAAATGLAGTVTLAERPKNERKLSERLHLGNRGRSSSSVNIPQGLQDEGLKAASGEEEQEAKWEERATLLARAGNSVAHGTGGGAGLEAEEGKRSRSVSVSDARGDVGIPIPLKRAWAGENIWKRAVC
ncbi:hypothetical protein H2201_000708 [Coniosporium apollinis]|uniref:Uncharacterized protein n=1 Tax=Coniosporium apollinis TaxID=61459 RepID=A0ABQ9P5T8_9PEZI|nr:hypothetical protein H2201_000708 [Coniosporium apollinis]